jgi:hypothetical protein
MDNIQFTSRQCEIYGPIDGNGKAGQRTVNPITST